MRTPRRVGWIILGILILTGCGRDRPTVSYPLHFPADFSREREFAEDDRHRFRFPIEGLADHPDPISCVFSSWKGLAGKDKYHAAEDYPGPPGTPVFAMADGEVSFSGRMGGYGWLIIVDHPKPNLYSLYGHLSPSRWRREEGAVQKGDLLAYLGDPFENGGSRKNPLPPHLHFGIRAGQRTDYPGKGEWRWQAGWIRPRPTDLGWLHPSDIINAQHVPAGGFEHAAGDLFEVWGIELILISIYFIGGACVLISATRRRKPWMLIVAAAICLVAGWVLGGRGLQLARAVYIVAAVLAAVGMWGIVRPTLLRRRGS